MGLVNNGIAAGRVALRRTGESAIVAIAVVVGAQRQRHEHTMQATTRGRTGVMTKMMGMVCRGDVASADRVTAGTNHGRLFRGGWFFFFGLHHGHGSRHEPGIKKEAWQVREGRWGLVRDWRDSLS